MRQLPGGDGIGWAKERADDGEDEGAAGVVEARDVRHDARRERTGAASDGDGGDGRRLRRARAQREGVAQRRPLRKAREGVSRRLEL
ncbi:MAG: hypothetical protein IPG50_16565 [Myxococcales bacterium]|nr:hypothetical protein [Myxococcales bacterium]